MAVSPSPTINISKRLAVRLVVFRVWDFTVLGFGFRVSWWSDEGRIYELRKAKVSPRDLVLIS